MAKELIREINKITKPLKQRIFNVVARAVLALVDDDPKMQAVQVDILEGETKDGIERFQNYGFSSVPKKGAECIILALGGNRDHVVVIVADDRRYRPTGLDEGDSCQYTSKGIAIHCKDDGAIEIYPREGEKVTIHGDLHITGNLNVDGTCDCDD